MKMKEAYPDELRAIFMEFQIKNQSWQKKISDLAHVDGNVVAHEAVHLLNQKRVVSQHRIKIRDKLRAYFNDPDCNWPRLNYHEGRSLRNSTGAVNRYKYTLHKHSTKR